MRQLAGKYAKELLEKPVALMATGGLGAAGLATLGNVASGQSEYESPTRMGLEALGAGTLGALAARSAPAIAKRYGREAAGDRILNALTSPKAKAEGAKLSPAQLKAAENQMLNVADLYQKTAPYRGAAYGTGLALGAGGLGGQFGGGLANVGNMAGLPIDPELPGSSNTLNSRLNMQGYV
tara:strand:+ start:260 stop:802 length:543 start_codon:yes stop_codon:yes gene_type:complete